MKRPSFINARTIRIVLCLVTISMFVASCGNDRGGVIVDASGEQGGGTQPGGGGFAFSVLFLVVAASALGMFTMDRIKKNKSKTSSDDQK